VILILADEFGAGSGRLAQAVRSDGIFFIPALYDFDSTLVFVALKGTRVLADDASLESGLELRLVNLSTRRRSATRSGAMAALISREDWTDANAPLSPALALEKFTYSWCCC